MLLQRRTRTRISAVLLALWLFALLAMAINGCLHIGDSVRAATAHATLVDEAPASVAPASVAPASVAPALHHGQGHSLDTPVATDAADVACASFCNQTSKSSTTSGSADVLLWLALLVPPLLVLLVRHTPVVPPHWREALQRGPLAVPLSILFLRLNN